MSSPAANVAIDVFNAVQRGDHTSLAHLLSNAKDAANTQLGGRTPLHLAAEIGNGHVVDTLLAAGANITIRDTMDWTPIAWALGEGHYLYVLQRLIAAGATFDKGDLAHATILGKMDVINFMLSLGMDVNEADETGDLPLHIAIEFGHTELVCRLLSLGADPNRANGDGSTPFDIAMDHHPDMVQMLLDSGARVPGCLAALVTPLQERAAAQQAEIAALKRELAEWQAVPWQMQDAAVCMALAARL